MFTLLVATLIASVSAFSPAAIRRSTGHALQMGFEKEIGAQPPLGFFDPLGLLKNADQERFDQLRRYEVKHGRVAMLAVLGHIVTTAGWRANGDIAFGVPFSSVKNGLAALDTIPVGGIFQIIAFIGLLELGFEYQEKNIADECKLRMNEWGWSEAKQKSKYAIELNNGRAAQMGILTLMVHEKLNNDPYIINSLLGAPVPFN
mmetsp:Transcript_2793/g.3881  ORF Transcript_2793/g.3881 Transcript_2793/m.3881 type:complete len:203 (+) Transcript_2793:48-656(+)|eukprot:CAMPEP_0201099888 /NCGR_PEP_ID=MMETSP0812-20130820/8836_1 /ASSEMBLY_ACC=CAM_ASM_000668 /TAXON_ID=98059 /ORGANISM="Dinobryon sp., Strain UTEXLB2267" /LENGTH=202 /DNA_ID=CAMNT_0047356005 /DNA_START=48 /DNA_END=656 /DNA_ORIENTATION=-